MPEPIKEAVKIQGNDKPVDVQMGLRSDGCFVLIFDQPVRDLAFTRMEVLSLKQAIDMYLERPII